MLVEVGISVLVGVKVSVLVDVRVNVMVDVKRAVSLGKMVVVGVFSDRRGYMLAATYPRQ